MHANIVVDIGARSPRTPTVVGVPVACGLNCFRTVILENIPSEDFVVYFSNSVPIDSMQFCVSGPPYELSCTGE